MQSSNPYRREVLAWYHKIVKSAFTVPWTTDEDAMYILSESRRLFRANQNITDLAAIRRKIDEAEMRYGIAVHYLIPYPRPSHKTQGSTQESGIAYHPAFDSLMDSAKSPLLGDTREGTATMAFASGSLGESASRMRDGFSGMDDTLDGLTFQKPFEP